MTTKLRKHTNVAIAEVFGISLSPVSNCKTIGIPINKLQVFTNTHNAPLNWLLPGEETENRSGIVYRDRMLRKLLIELAPK